MEEIRIDWSAAEVEDRELTVPLVGKASKQWRAHLERALGLMAVDRVEVEKQALKVSSLEPGEEERVYALLEGVVAQANGDCDAEPAKDSEQERSREDEPDEDAQLTGAYRAFAAR